MNKQWMIGLIALFFILALSRFASAETIVLKSGQTIKGKITEKTGQYIKIDVSGVAVPFFLDEIKSVDGGGCCFFRVQWGRNYRVRPRGNQNSFA